MFVCLAVREENMSRENKKMRCMMLVHSFFFSYVFIIEDYKTGFSREKRREDEEKKK